MTRKMQREVLTLDTASLKLIRLMMTGAVAMFIMFAVAMMLVVTPAHADTQNHKTNQLTVWVEALPHNFQAKTINAGVNVIGVEDMFGTSIVVIEPAKGQDHNGVLEVLYREFPTLEFDTVSDEELNIELVEN